MSLLRGHTVLGIDLGTQGLKLLAYEPARRELRAQVHVPLEVARNAAGSAEQRVEDWEDALERGLDALGSRVRATIRAIGVSGQQHGFVALDEDGRALAPVKLWCDTSTEAEAHAIEAALGGRAAALRETGNPVLVGYTASKVRWLRDHAPEDYARLHTILLPHDYVNLVLTGERCMEAGDASGTGFFDVRARRWSAAALRAIDPERDLAECLPEVRLESGAIGRLSSAAAERFDLPSDALVAVGAGDNMAAAIGTGAVGSGALTVSLGTSGTVFGAAAKPVCDPAGEIAAFCSSTGGWLPLLCTMNCTGGTELVRGLVGATLNDLEHALEQTAPGASGLTTVPYFAGERTPNLPSAKGCVFGLDALNAEPKNLLRSGVEGATFGLLAGIERLVELGLAGEILTVTGGGSASAAWRQLLADASGLPVRSALHAEGAAFGAALQALHALEGAATPEWNALIADHVAFVPELGAEPRPEQASAYADARATYAACSARVAEQYPNDPAS